MMQILDSTSEGAEGERDERIAPSADPNKSGKKPEETEDGGYGFITRAVAVVAVVDAVAVGYFAGRGAGASAAYGATVGLANLVALGRMVRAFFVSGRASIGWVIVALTKLAVLVLAMYLPVRAGLVQVLPFVIGFGALPLGIVLGQLLNVPPTSREN